jgi:RNA polymerase sigma-B factor
MSVTSLAQSLRDDQLIDHFHDGDLEARRIMIERYLPFARRLALRYSYTNEPMDDLIQVACVGLIGAVQRFDASRGSAFASFAAPTILGELKRYFRDKAWTMRVPRDLQERAMALGHATEKLSARLGRSPTMPELADHLGCSVEEALEASEVAHSYHPPSLDAPLRHDADGPSALIDLLGAEDSALDLVEERDRTTAIWNAMPGLERKVVELRFGEHLTQREIAQRIGYSQMHVSRLLRRALDRLLHAGDDER